MATQKEINKLTEEGDSHQFAFYGSEHMLLKQSQGTVLAVKDEELIHRIVRVVKLKVAETFVVFDQKKQALVELVNCSRNDVTVRIVNCRENIILYPKITWFLPLLKKEALEDAAYSLAELGVNNIQLVVTDKSRKSLMDKEILRLQKIIIAAAEQSKHYAFPVIYPAKNLKECLADVPLSSDKVVFDISGESFFEIRKQMTSSETFIIVGPEGGLTVQELQGVKEQGFQACSLTPTVLRALQAVAVGAALFRIS